MTSSRHALSTTSFALGIISTLGALLALGGCGSNQPYTLDKTLFGFDATFTSEPLDEERPTWQTKFSGLSASGLMLEVRPENDADLKDFRTIDLSVTLVNPSGYVVNSWSGPISEDWDESRGRSGRTTFHQYRRASGLGPLGESTLCVTINSRVSDFRDKRIVVIISDHPTK